MTRQVQRVHHQLDFRSGSGPLPFRPPDKAEAPIELLRPLVVRPGVEHQAAVGRVLGDQKHTLPGS